MNRQQIFQGAAVAALVALAAILAMLAASTSLPAGVTMQPGLPAAPGEFFLSVTAHSGSALGFFGADNLFILSYLMVFVGLYLVTAERARPFAVIGLGAGVLTALFDALENALFIFQGQAAAGAVTVPGPDVMTVLLFTQLKWMAAFATLYAFAIAFPRKTWFEWLLLALMIAFPLVGVLGIANSGLVAVRSLFFLVGMPLFAIYFWLQSRVVQPA